MWTIWRGRSLYRSLILFPSALWVWWHLEWTTPDWREGEGEVEGIQSGGMESDERTERGRKNMRKAVSQMERQMECAINVVTYTVRKYTLE